MVLVAIALVGMTTPKAALKVANLDMGHPNLDMERNFWRMISRSSDVAETDITVLPGFRSLRYDGEGYKQHAEMMSVHNIDIN
eukprot:4968218-Amphidinium_carterae.1